MRLTIKPTLMISEVDASNNSNYFSNLPEFTMAAYLSDAASRVDWKSAICKWTTTFDFATLMSSTSVLSRDVQTQSDFTLLLGKSRAGCSVFRIRLTIRHGL